MNRWIKRLAAVVAGLGLGLLGTGIARAAVLLSENWSSYPVGQTYADGVAFGPWRVEYNGYGYTKIAQNNVGANRLEQAPKASTSPGETHAALTLTQASYTPTLVTASFRTISQLRTGSAPNPWEVAWLLWNYTDDDHFYSVNLKPNGWELGKEDPAYPGSQRYLATGSTPTYPIGAWYHLDVTQTVSNGLPTFTVKATVSATGAQTTLATFTDHERPYLSGKVGLYNEDAKTWFATVTVQG